MNLEFHPAVQRDVNEIMAYYMREASAALADRFYTDLLIQLARIAEHPEQFSPYPPSPRHQRAFLPGFPHVILFRMNQGLPRILVIKHQKQHPRRGLTRR
ncbi:MAG: type II toxin-antitoxin system RelE/ParE family toxin [Verrucomicrobiales bacterium]|nr:type II toxin-antitoxin system RelE/ParE family toxin [Verrucomicrobiales bacterium]